MSSRGKASVRQLALPLGRTVHGDETGAGKGDGKGTLLPEHPCSKHEVRIG